MEVVVNEEKKKIFRARKTMKISDRQQLETLHSTLLTSSSGLSNSPPPLMNGTHKEDGPNPEDNQQGQLEPVSPNDESPSSPTPELSLNLSPSPESAESPNAKDDLPGSPVSPFHSLNSELKKLENDESRPSSPNLNLDIPSEKAPKQTPEDHTEPVAENEAVEDDTTEDQAESTNSVKDSEGLPPQSPVVQTDCSEPMETDSGSTKAVDSATAETKTDKQTDEKTPSSLSSNEVVSSPSSACKAEATVTEKDAEPEKVKEKNVPVAEVKKEAKVAVDLKTKVKSEKDTIKQARPSSTPPSDAVKEERTSGIKRTLSEGFEPNGPSISREVKRPKMENEEFEAQLELKITAKAGNHLKLEKIVQKLVEDKLRVLEMSIFDRSLQELKDRVDQIDCRTKHHTAMNTLQAKIARLAKKFGEANQASENKKKQEALAAAAAASSNTTPAPPAPAAKTVPNSLQTQRPARSSVEVKQTTTIAVASTSIPSPATTTPAISASVPTTTTLVSQTPILQLIASTANAVSNLTASSTTQSPTSTLVLKNGMMATGQPLLIQLPLSMANGQAGTLVNIPVSSLNAVTSLNKAKTTAPTTTFILKSAPTSTAVPSAATLPAIQAPVSHVPTSQISLARAVYQGGAGGITTPNSGVSVTSVRAPTQSVSVAGAMSSASSLVTSGPAATGSTAPGPPQGTSLTTKTDNQVPGPSSSKAPPSAPRPKGSVIDLTEEDDDVLVTGVKSATVTTATAIRSQTSITSTARSSPQTNPTSSSNPQLSTHHRPLLDSKSRNTTSTPTRSSSVALPPLPSAPVPPRLPPEAEKTSVPQQPQLKLVPSQTGIVLSWCVAETDLTCAAVDSYHLYAFHQDNSNSNPSQQHWKKIGEVKALPLPMACTLTQFQTGSTYHFAVRAKDIYGRFGAFCEPQCTNVINSSSS
ncbi:activating transcription factor 7-interacting protein 1 isoform X1 [Periophthalmus magnuspinnatus]|uniref:activating transcription factor 7-interacting protein 1 isoform X1 n=1 Tax=Periophthalmus magnuspinnatus TaxID=409849 RepID=UPI00145B79ED|nr:activating transcription factor 7-interacting protein 1 isoform X1 [Periophthalmus magnuspinnatus]